MTLKGHAKSEKIDLWLGNYMRQIFIRTLESVKIGTFMADFGPG